MQQEQCPSCGQFWISRPQSPPRWALVVTTVLLVLSILVAIVYVLAIINLIVVSRRFGFLDIGIGRLVIDTMVVALLFLIATNLFAAARRRKRFAVTHAMMRQCRTCGFQWEVRGNP